MKRQTGKNDKNLNLKPACPLGQRFTQYYSYGWDFIEKPIESDIELDSHTEAQKDSETPKTGWKTHTKYPLSLRHIWDYHQDPNKIIGLRFGNTTRIIIIDLDRNSPYHPLNNPKALKKIRKVLEKIGLNRIIIIQSSHSGGIHLIIPLDRELPTFKTAALVRTTLEQAGFVIKSGQLEIFPNTKKYNKNQKTHYNGVRLPLQPNTGSYLLDDDINPISDQIEDLLDQMDWAADGQDLDTFTSLLDPTYEAYKAKLNQRYSSPSDLLEQWEKDLKSIMEQGWTDYHQTNHLLIKFTTYCIVFLGLQGTALRQTLKQKIVAANGYLKYCRHQHEIDQRIEQICYTTEKNGYYLPYCNIPERLANFNQTYNPTHQATQTPQWKPQTLDTYRRLAEIVSYLDLEGKLPSQATFRREIIQKTAKEQYGKGFSHQTFSKKIYKALWHPQYRASDLENAHEVELPIKVIQETQQVPSSETQSSTKVTQENQQVPPSETESSTKVTQETQPQYEEDTSSPSETPEALSDKDLNPVSSPNGQKEKKLNSETLASSELESSPPIYEVFLVNIPQKKKTFPTTTQSQTPSTHSQKPSEVLSAVPTSPNTSQPVVSSNRLQIAQKALTKWQEQKAWNDRNKQGLQDYGFPIPESILNIERELEAKLPQILEEIEQSELELSQNPENLSDSPSQSNNPSTAHGANSEGKSGQLTELNPSKPPINVPQFKIPPSASEDGNLTPPDENQSPKSKKEKEKDLEKFLNLCDDYGIVVNRTIRRVVKSQIDSSSEQVVYDALEAFKEYKRQGQIHNPSAFLVKAIKEQWKPIVSDDPTQYSPEFYDWYEKAISAGVVEDLPPNWLGRDSYGQPMVRVWNAKTHSCGIQNPAGSGVFHPIGQPPYTLMVWTEVRNMDLFSQ